MRNNINFFAKWSPFFMLSECDGGGEFCKLGRSWQPEYRALYEKELVKLLTNKIKKYDRTIHYTDFACGGMFQTLVTLVKTLINNPQAHIVVHLIDLQFIPLAEALDVAKKSRRVGKAYEEHNEEEMQQLKEQTKERLSNEEFKFAELIIKKNLLQLYSMFEQFASFFKHYFPYARVEVCAYSSAEDYAKKSQYTPDVLSTVDIQDMYSGYHHAYWNYATLCLYGLGHKYDSQNLFLERKDSFLGSAYLTKITTDSTKEFKYYKNKKVTLVANGVNELHESVTYYVHRKLLKIGWSGKEIRE